MKRVLSFAPLFAIVFAIACSSSPATAPASNASPAPASDDPAETADRKEVPVAPSPYEAIPEAVRSHLDDPFTGDGDKMIERRLIRAGVVFNRSQYFIDRGQQRGFVYEAIKLFEEQINKRLKTGNLPIHVAFVPLSRDQLFPALAAGKVDLVAAALTITPGREKMVAFSNPTRTNVSEIVVTQAGTPEITSVDALSGQKVFARRSSAYYENLTKLNAELKSRGKAPVVIEEAPEALEDDDLLEMVNAGLMPAVVVDDFVAKFWQQVFPKLQLHPKAAVATNGTIAVAVRKNNPILLRAVNTWIKEYGPRTTFGNVMDRRYLQNAAYAKTAGSQEERQKFERLVTLFKKYGDQYDVDYVLMAAQGYQESQLNQEAKSHVGAVGIMQIMPATGKELAVGDIGQVEPNIHGGVKYMRFMMNQYYKDEPMTNLDKGLMTLASYNAGPRRVRQLRDEAFKRGLDRNVWFGNVERIASERIGRETVTYVANIYKYYVAYHLWLDQEAERAESKQAAKSGS